MGGYYPLTYIKDSSDPRKAPYSIFKWDVGFSGGIEGDQWHETG